jgi:hypothetical protein
MRRPDYISTEQTRYQPTTMEKVESKIGYVVRYVLIVQWRTFYVMLKAKLVICSQEEDGRRPAYLHGP